MERSEPTLVPEWLKGVSSLAGTPHLFQSNFNQDDGGALFSSRHRDSQQISAAGSNHGDYDSPRYSVTSDRSFFSSSRRGSSIGSSVIERPAVERESFSQAWGYSLGHSSSNRSYDEPERDLDGLHGDRDWERECEGERESRNRDGDRRSGRSGVDDREREHERSESGTSRRAMSGSGKMEVDSALLRLQSMGLSTRGYDDFSRKINEVVSLPVVAAPSAACGLAMNMQKKAAFEWNFPSLGTDDRQGSVQQIMGNVAIVSPRPLRPGSCRPDFGWSSSLGFNSVPGSISVSSSGNMGGSTVADMWNSALVEGPGLNENVLDTVPSLSTATAGSNVTSRVASAISSNALNMAEALVQNPPCVRTPQLFIESQRLEELALKQSRQLIPMTPSLPKTMVASDKPKPKMLRTVDIMVPSALKISQATGSSQPNSPHRPLVTSRPETPKSSQGKLLVLKSNKDGATSLASSMKLDGSNPVQATSLVSTGISPSAAGLVAPVNGSSLGVIGARKQKQFLDRKALPVSAVSGPNGADGGIVRSRDNSVIVEDKRPSTQAQNRSDFFNAIRKKAASYGALASSTEKLDSSSGQIMDEVNMKIQVSDNTIKCNGYSSQVNTDGTGQIGGQCFDKSNFTHCNGGSRGKHSRPTIDFILEETEAAAVDASVVEGLNEGQASAYIMGGTEEEEAAFLRSLGWEEDAEGGEALTEEEISSFYQMREKKKLMNGRNLRWVNIGVEQHFGSLEIASSGPSSSDSESDDELHV